MRRRANYRVGQNLKPTMLQIQQNSANTSQIFYQTKAGAKKFGDPVERWHDPIF